MVLKSSYSDEMVIEMGNACSYRGGSCRGIGVAHCDIFDGTLRAFDSDR